MRDAQDTGSDPELTEALRLAVSLHASAGRWRFTKAAEPPVCKSGCYLLRIEGTRREAARYTLRLTTPAGKALASARLRAPPGTALFQLAEALVVKGSFLLESLRAAAAGNVAQERSAENPPFRRPRRPPPAVDPLVRTLGAGPSLMIGLDRSFRTLGVEVGGTVGLVGPFSFRAVIAYQALGRGDGHTYRTLPLALMAGGAWQGSRWGVGAFGGLSMMALWLDFDSAAAGSESEVGVGLAVEGRATLRVYRRLLVGVSVRGLLLFGDAEVKVDELTLFRLPKIMLATTLELAVAF